MLLGKGQRVSDFADSVDSVHNYYEQLVLDCLIQHYPDEASDPNYLADLTCVALNHLPPRYVRHNVDMTFFLSPQELAEIDHKVKQAVANAVQYVHDREAEKQQA